MSPRVRILALCVLLAVAGGVLVFNLTRPKPKPGPQLPKGSLCSTPIAPVPGNKDVCPGWTLPESSTTRP